MAFKEVLTPIIGNVKEETTAEFMNAKFTELLDNTKDNKQQINILSNINLISKGLLKANNNEQVKISCLGTSITQGFKADIPYPTTLQTSLRTLLFNTDITVINQGIGGDTTQKALDRIDTVISQAPDICILELGMNDCIYDVPIATFTSNLCTIIDILLSNNIGIIMTTPTPLTQHENRYKLSSYVSACIDVSNKKSIKLIDMNSIYWDLFKRTIYTPLGLIEDGIHPIYSKPMSDIIIRDLLMLNSITSTLELPFVYTNLCRTDITDVFLSGGTNYGGSYFLNGVDQKILICPFFINNKTARLHLNTIRFTNCGSYNVRIDDVIVNELNLEGEYEDRMYALIGDVDYGLHYFTVKTADKTTTSNGSNLYLTSIAVTTPIV